MCMRCHSGNVVCFVTRRKGDVGSIGSYTRVPSQFGSPLAYFLVRPLVPEPPVTLLVAVGIAAIGAATGRRRHRRNSATSVD